jgi:hypothetical protein
LRRGHVLRLSGKPERFARIPELTSAFVQSRLLALEELRLSRRLVEAPVSGLSESRALGMRVYQDVAWTA